jgi:hypothetical protein
MPGPRRFEGNLDHAVSLSARHTDGSVVLLCGTATGLDRALRIPDTKANLDPWQLCSLDMPSFTKALLRQDFLGATALNSAVGFRMRRFVERVLVNAQPGGSGFRELVEFASEPCQIGGRIRSA